MSLIGISANCGKHTYVLLFSSFSSREYPECQSTSAMRARVLRVGNACYPASTRVLVHICIWIFYGTFTFPRRFLFPPISSTRCARRTENNARDPTPINWFLRDICNFLTVRLSPRSFIAHFICARPPLSRRSAEARNHGWSYVTFTLELAKLIRLFFNRTNNAVSVWYKVYVAWGKLSV